MIGNFGKVLIERPFMIMVEKFKYVLFSVLYSFTLVLTFYIQHLFLPRYSRNQYRMYAMIFLGIFSIFLIYKFQINNYFNLYASKSNSICSILGTVLLFLGPIIQNEFFQFNKKQTHPEISGFNFLKSRFRKNMNFDNIQSFVIVPISEELICRCFICSLWESNGISNSKIIFLSPIAYGVSHFFQFFIDSGSAKSRLQFYTTECVFTIAFGWWLSLVWLRTHSFATCFVIHSFVLFMGFPEFRNVLRCRIEHQKILIMVGYLLGFTSFVGAVGYLVTAK